MDEVECHVKMMVALYHTGWMHGPNPPNKLKIAQVRVIGHRYQLCHYTDSVSVCRCAMIYHS